MLYELNREGNISFTNLNLLQNVKLRSILVHKRLTDSVNKIEIFKTSIQKYKETIENIEKILKEKTNIPMDIIKYNILKMI
jgi:conjugal transfer/entry exclusion protein